MQYLPDPNHRFRRIRLTGPIYPSRTFTWFLALCALFASAASPADVLKLQEELKKDYELGIQHLQHGEHDEAIQAFERVLSINPNVPAVHNLIGVVYSQKPDGFQDAIEAFQRAIGLDPRFADAYYNMANLYMFSGTDPILTEEYLEKTIELDPHFAKAYMNLGWIYLVEKEDHEEAMAYLEKCVALDPGLAKAQYGLGLAYFMMGKNASVLKPISVLRNLNENEWANTLEAMLSEEKSPADIKLEDIV